jgi:transcriptional regulator of acetoin/glycerol metabolism
VSFDVVPREQARRVEEGNHLLVSAARPVLEQLGRAIASTRYFAILTNQDGVVVDAHGPIDRGDPRAALITRVGVDLSERSVGTTAIGAALAELQPVWLHRGEHFFDMTACYSCAGAPLFGPDGRCVGMLDLTGIDAAERPELKHLVSQSARSIENALTLSLPHRLALRLNWPGRLLGDDDDGLVCLDGDGWVTGSNPAARQMLAGLAAGEAPVHCSELFAQPWEQLFDLAKHGDGAPVELPLWSGLRLSCMAHAAGEARTGTSRLPLRDVEIALIRKAVNDARGNVMEAARALGISRATVYRKLGHKPGR